MSGCAHCEMPVSPGELCPVDGAGTDHAHEDLEHTKITEFDCEEEAGSRAPVKVADPKLPSAEEVETHNLTHLPYRSWCPHCVRGKGKTMDHRRAGRPKMIPELHVDYCFMGSKGDATARCIVVTKDYEHKCVMASVVPIKGSSHEIPAKRSGAFIRELGLEGQDIVLRSEQEPALQDLLTRGRKETDSSENIPRGLSCGIVGFAWRGRERSTNCRRASSGIERCARDAAGDGDSQQPQHFGVVG